MVPAPAPALTPTPAPTAPEIFFHMIESAAKMPPFTARVALPKAYEKFVGNDSFDLDAATATWLCPVTTNFTGRWIDLAKQHHLLGVKNARTWYQQVSTICDFQPMVMAQLLLRPSQAIREVVLGFEREHNLTDG